MATSTGPESGTETFQMELKRTFEAPVTEVWKAWTEKDDVHQWWGPTAFTAPEAEMDVREGGTHWLPCAPR